MCTVESIEDLDALLELSKTKPVVLFKHSTRCSISTLANDAYKAYLETADTDAVEYTYLDLLEHRDVSNAIAQKTGVWHQSPQVILVKDGKAVWNTSHLSITAEALKEAITAHI